MDDAPIHPDHPYADPGDGRTECEVCGKWVFECIHSCKRVPVTEAAWDRFYAKQLRHPTNPSLRGTGEQPHD